MLVGSDRSIASVSDSKFERLSPHVADALWRLAIDSARTLEARRIANLQKILRVLGSEETLTDDRPVLEARTYQRARVRTSCSLRSLAQVTKRTGVANRCVSGWNLALSEVSVAPKAQIVSSRSPSFRTLLLQGLRACSARTAR